LVFFLLTAAFFFMTAFVSYLFTGKADQSVVEAFNTTDIRESGFEIGNWFGLLGALSSHYFIYKWFGLASFFHAALFVPARHIRALQKAARVH
jgi:S-DNA-T family DNA segregation ATPase FtsK/SpoIIIE